ncbi:thioredoxin [Ancylobacter mangrovi]|uniref:Thioredoxin n=1 Tax=Ancylobacter mangrovi TaxID=2972472 RepID=A0A9X2PGY7_9HYPH|nr:thioredoxin [Ancylobacter mangrovi]MCS0495212.1 thioredoxin [Ancylobacter mangrovi]MCS0502607.1 thioredoxin [Ancylobacter mangrovi]
MLLNQPANPAQDGAAAAGDDVVIDVTTRSFMTDVVEESRRRPVLVDFWAPWCGPCKQLTPIIEKVVREAKGKVRLAKMNTDEHPSVAQQLGIQSLPTVYAFVNGQPVDGFMGAQPETQVKALVDRLVAAGGGEAGDIADVVASGEAALAEGDLMGAVEIFTAVLAEEPANLKAIAGLARAQLAAGSLAQAKATLALAPESAANDATISAVRAAIELEEAAAELGDVRELAARVEANPLDHQARFDLALALNARGKREEAVDELLAIVRKDRNWNDDGARKQLVQFFEAWGPTDEHTVAGRRRLSSILFA